MNKAFAQLINLEDPGAAPVHVTDTPLATLIPGLMPALRTVHVDGKSIERRTA